MDRHVMINGREVIIPKMLITGQELKALAGVAPQRNLILQRSEGNYLVSNEQQIQLQGDDYFADAPTFEYG